MGVNSFLFTFTSKSEAIEVLQKGPWCAMGNLLKEWGRRWKMKIHKWKGAAENLHQGHEQRECKISKIMEASNPALPKYGACLGAPPAKSLSELMNEQGLWNRVPKVSMGANQASKQKVGDGQGKQEEVGPVETQAELSVQPPTTEGTNMTDDTTVQQHKDSPLGAQI
ncbi:ABC transporter substrate-binding protein [Sesbania bispinosa]|nr:ABC transporter substrate-binding protein [Sesbania bispinosa]